MDEPSYLRRCRNINRALAEFEGGTRRMFLCTVLASAEDPPLSPIQLPIHWIPRRSILSSRAGRPAEKAAGCNALSLSGSTAILAALALAKLNGGLKARFTPVPLKLDPNWANQ
jgi:hypothetical protein